MRARKFLAVLLSIGMITGMNLTGFASGNNAEAGSGTPAESVQEGQKDSPEEEYTDVPSLNDLYVGGEDALSYEFYTKDRAAVEEILGNGTGTTSEGTGTKQKSRLLGRLFAAPVLLGAGNSGDWTFSDKYILYSGNIGTTKTDTEQDLTGDGIPAGQILKIQVDFEANRDFAANEVKILIPKSLYAYRNNSGEALYSQIGVPSAPRTNKSSPFNYTIEGDNIVLTNAKAIKNATTNMVQIFYSLNDMSTEDGTAWNIVPKVDIGGTQYDGTALKGSMDTSVTLNKVTKEGYQVTGSLLYPELYTKKQVNSWLTKAGLTELPYSWVFGNYKYIIWKTAVTGSNSQPWDLNVTDMPSNGGIVLGQYLESQYHSVMGRSSGGTFAMADQATYSFGDADALYTLVAYPTGSWPTSGNTVSNDISVTAKGSDGKDDAATQTAHADWTWEEYNWTYNGEWVPIKDTDPQNSPNNGEAWVDMYLSNKAANQDTVLPNGWDAGGYFPGYALTGNAVGKEYDGTKSYTVGVADDVELARTNNGTYRVLGKGDYYYSSISFTGIDTAVDIYENEYTSQTEGDVFSVYVMTADDTTDTWQHVDDVAYRNIGTYQLSNTWMNRKIYRVKVEHKSNDFSTEIHIRTKMTLCAGSQTVNALISENNFTEMTIEDLVGIWVFDSEGKLMLTQPDTNYDDYIHDNIPLDTISRGLYKNGNEGFEPARKNAKQVVRKMRSLNSVEKFASGVNDANNAHVKLTYTLTGWDGYPVYSQDAATMLSGKGITVARDHVTFYDLLPIGVTFDPSVAVQVGQLKSIVNKQYPGSWDSSDVMVTAETTDNYQDSGRQMVTFNVRYNGADNSATYAYNNGTSVNTTYWFSGFGVQFGAYYPWKNTAISNDAENVCAYVTDDAQKGTAYADNGANAPDSVRGYFGHLDPSDDQIVRNVQYATARVNVDSATSGAAQLYKTVKSDANPYGEKTTSAQVETGQTYTYTVSVSTTTSKMKNLVLYDHLENAAAAGEPQSDTDTITYDPNYWTGTFLGINTAALSDEGIRPVVYYSTSSAAPYDISNSSWVKKDDYTGNLSDVKSVAVDITKKTDGTSDYVMGENVSLYFTIRMKAPADLQTPATYAYNNTSYTGNLTIDGVTAGTPKTQTSDATKVSLYKKTKLTIEKTEINGEGADQDAEFDFLVTVSGDTYSYREYTLYEKDAAGTFQAVAGIHATDAEGRVTLKLGQKAEFPDMPVGSAYSVKEDTGLNWIATTQNEVKKEATGTIEDADVTAVEFKNTYKALFFFDKKTEFTTGATNTDDLFTFRLMLNNVPVADTEYYLVNPSVSMNAEQAILKADGTPGTAADVQRTGSDGSFTIRAGQRIAVRTDAGESYSVTETAGYGDNTDWLCQNPTVTGTVRAPYTSAYIMNDYRYKDFYVTKNMKDKAGEIYALNDHDKAEEFTFTLTIDNVPFANADYDVYTGYSSYSAGRKTGSGTTDREGQFRLKYGETAIIKQTPAGGNYQVTETPDPDYPCIDPVSGTRSGRISRTQEKGGDITFTNSVSTRDLLITKSVQYKPENAAEATAQEFRFVLKVNKTGGEPATASNAEIYRGTGSGYQANGTYTRSSTDENGIFELKHNEFIVLKDQPIGETYEIYEYPTDGYSYSNPADGKISGSITSQYGPATAAYTNMYGEANSLILKKTWTLDPSVTDEATKALFASYRKNLHTALSLRYFYANGTTDEYGYDLSQIRYPEAGTAMVMPNNNYADFYGNSSIEITKVPDGMTYRAAEESDNNYWRPDTQNFMYEGFASFTDSNQKEHSWYFKQTAPENNLSADVISGRTEVDFANMVYPHLYVGSLAKTINGISLSGVTKSSIESNPEYSRLAGSIMNKELKFRLLRKNADGEYEPAAGVAYNDSIGYVNSLQGSESDRYTDEYGNFTLRPRYVTSTYGDTILGGLACYFKAEMNADAIGTTTDDSEDPYQVVELTDSDDAFGTFFNKTYYREGNRAQYTFYDMTDDAGRSLTVKKTVTGENPPDETFKFALKTVNINGNNMWNDMGTDYTTVYTSLYTMEPYMTKEAAANIPYKIVNAVTGASDGITYHTDTDGIFSLKADEKAVFSNLSGKLPSISIQSWIDHFGDEENINCYLNGLPTTSPVYSVTEIASEMPEGFYNTGHAEQYDIAMGDREYSGDEYSSRAFRTSSANTDMVFTNQYDPAPNLKITKTVNGGTEETSNDEFGFALKVSGTAYKKQDYTKYDASGTVIPNYAADGTTVIPWSTDSYGRFSLKAGETAEFAWVGAGKAYEITEDAKDHYTQVSPAAGSSASGVVASLGSRETFVNEYQRAAAQAQLKVQKYLSWPTGLGMPANTSFTFHVRVDNADFASKAYALYDADGRRVSGTHATDGNGDFTLGAGEYALFTNIGVDSDYQVEEVIPDNASYRLISSEGTTGVMSSAGAIANFTNAQANFLVKKDVTSAANQTAPADDTFTFVATANGRALANREYLRYNSNGTQDTSGTFTTDADGKFMLKAGQSALFTGLPSGTPVTVREETKTNYTQTIPDTAAGYSRTMGDTADVLTFENRYDQQTAVRVTMTVVPSVPGTSVPTDEEFTCTFYRTDASGNRVPAANAVYTLNGRTYRTDADGHFRLRNGESAYFSRESAGSTVYGGEEALTATQSDAGYERETTEPVRADLTAGQESEITLTNTYTGSYGITYEWSPDSVVPEDAILPTDTNTYIGITEAPVDPTYRYGYTVRGTHNGTDGVYVFHGYTSPDVDVNSTDTNFTMPGNGNVTLVGRWTFEERRQGTVSYEWSGDVPDILATPAEATAEGGDTVNVDTTYPDGYTMTGTRNGVTGTYTFHGWTEVTDSDRNAVDVNTGTGTFSMPNGKNVTVRGEWTFTPEEISNLHGYEVTIHKTSDAAATEPVSAGDTVTYHLTVTNTGTTTAGYTAVSDPVPSGTTYESSDNGGVYVPGADAKVEWIVRDLAPEESKVLTYEVTVDTGLAGQISNTAVYGSSSEDPGTPGHFTATPATETNTIVHTTDTERNPVGPLIETEITSAEVASPSEAGRATGGSTVTYTITVTNHGGTRSGKVYLRSYLPRGTTYTGGDGSTYVSEGGYVEWSIPGIEPGEATELAYSVTVNTPPTGSLITSQVLYEENYSGSGDPANSSNIYDVATEAEKISVTKKWYNRAAKYLPKSIQVQLYKNGTAYGEPVTLTAATGWTYTWEDLPEYATASNATGSNASPGNADLEEDGSLADGTVVRTAVTMAASVAERITWSVKEVGAGSGALQNYKAAYPDSADGVSFIITNTYLGGSSNGSGGNGSGGGNGGSVSVISGKMVPLTSTTDSTGSAFGAGTGVSPAAGEDLSGRGLPRTGVPGKDNIWLLLLMYAVLLLAGTAAEIKRKEKR